MASLFGLFNTGRQGIFASQMGMSVTGNNISNVNTPGYSRQRVVVEQQRIGGVQVLGIQRMGDRFVEARVREAQSRVTAGQMALGHLETLESTLGNGAQSSVSDAVQDFFSAMNDLSLSPGGPNERQIVRTRAESLLGAMQSTAAQLRTQRQRIDNQLVDQVDRINAISAEIAEINSQVAGAGNSGAALDNAANPGLNAMLDRRDALMDELSAYVDINVITAENNSFLLYSGSSLLVEAANSFELSVEADALNDGMHRVFDTGGSELRADEGLDSGGLRTLLHMRDEEVGGALNDLERMAATFARDMNVQHSLGQDLNGLSHDFFSGLEVSAMVSADSALSVTGSAITDRGLLDFNDYELRFNAGGTYDVVDVTTGSTLSTGNPYSAGSPIVFNGLSVTVTGVAAAGDTIRLNTYDRTSSRLALAAEIQALTDGIAAGLSAEPGDNRNALAMLDLQSAGTMGGTPGQSYESYFDRLRVRVAGTTEALQTKVMQDEIGLQQVRALADGAKGVSLDEEATNILQFQRSFQASSRVISATDELIETVLNML